MLGIYYNVLPSWKQNVSGTSSPHATSPEDAFFGLLLQGQVEKGE